MADYQVIARRWRPKQFDDIVGQEHIVRTLKNAIQTNRIAHAYLFVGPRGTGKTSTARVFAKALNAEGGPRVDPDDDTEISRSIMAGNCLDVIEIDGASNNSVDQIRDLRDECQYAPTQCTYKIYIIDEVHMLTTQAFNALLKTLEEPPSHVKFLFATTEAQKVLPTITSRCQRFEFRPISDEVLSERLQRIAEAEQVSLDAVALEGIVKLAMGGMRDAQSILDQMISFCGTTIHGQDVLDVYGLVDPQRVEALARAMVNVDYAAIVGFVEEVAGEGRDLYRLLQDLERILRSALLDAVAHKGRSELLGVGVATEPLMRMLDALLQSEVALQKGLSDKVNFEVALLRAVDAGQSRALDNLLRELKPLKEAPAADGEKKNG
jgi:DNA polymerase-3 subunit gamma/tau